MTDVNKDKLIKSLISLGMREATKLAHQVSADRGWWDGVSDGECPPLVVATKIALIHTEVSEALEAYRNDKMDDKLTSRRGIEVELADVMIRVCDLAGRLGLDLGGAFLEKAEYNKTREDHSRDSRCRVGGKRF